jgi:hypothetical protein
LAGDNNRRLIQSVPPGCSGCLLPNSPSLPQHQFPGKLTGKPDNPAACADAATCPDGGDGVGLGLVPRTPITLDEHVPWHATPAFSGSSGGDGLPLPSLYWLQRVN